MSISLIVLIAVNILISLKGFNDSFFFNKYKFQIAEIRNKDYIRLFSSGFLHADYAHLFFNMLTLYFFAPVVIGNLNEFNFLIIYFASLVVGSLLSYKFHQKQLYYSAVGASGAVSGVLFSAILIHPKMSLFIFFIPLPIPAYIFGILYIIYSLYGMKKQNDSIGHTAHFGGALSGFVLTGFFNFNLLTIKSLFLVLIFLGILFYLLQKQKK